MTTIAYRAGVLAADSLCSLGDMKLPGNIKKLYRLPDGALYAYTGAVKHGLMMLEYLKGERDEMPEWGKAVTLCVLVEPDGTVRSYNGRDDFWEPWGGPYVAFGSGRDFAYAAFECDADAVKAVQVATKLDKGSRGPVRSLKLND